MARITGCHLVGSVNLSDTETVFRQVCSAMPRRLKRIPDGETNERYSFTLFQSKIFEAVPILFSPLSFSPSPPKSFTSEEVDAGIEQLQASGISTGYDDHAIESYAVFKRLRAEGVIPAGVRFQVCLPTAANIMLFVQQAFRSRVEPLYEEALSRAIHKIQSTIPHEDLSIQIDLAAETALWEMADAQLDGRTVPVTNPDWFRVWFDEDIKEHVINYLMRMIGQIDDDVELGLHNCYGDAGHQHWFEPTSLAAVVERGVRIMQQTSHPINYFHCPVPKSAIDNLDAFLAPLKDLMPSVQKQGTELYLGVIHEYRPEVTANMMDAASKVVPEFGVACECGLGRVGSDEIDDIFRVSASVSQPVL